MTDGFGRTIDYLRISVTDKCNLRCRYCMPREGIALIPHRELLTLEEVYRVVRIMAGMGICKVRITGGEPLVRKNVTKLIKDIHGLPGMEEIAMTTNGVLLGEQVEELKAAGLTGVNISLDTLHPQTFERITGFDRHGQVMEAVEKVLEQGMKLKINCVPCRGLNDTELTELASLAKERPVDIRYIELMPVGCGRDFEGIPSHEILAGLEACYGKAQLSEEKRGNGPARYYDFPGFCGKVGFISPISHKFCGECNRVRLTAEGRLKLCLHYDRGLELKPLLRGGATDGDIRHEVEEALQKKPKEHDFEHIGEREGSEKRKMVQIGG
ncbi:MAG: GTP 3',8-cyclase MoaA [Lachnospiraceae bacterium]|nr:GTP 3',8-cyclase MoaA [Lachnospiraceae bacterium]